MADAVSSQRQQDRDIALEVFGFLFWVLFLFLPHRDCGNREHLLLLAKAQYFNCCTLKIHHTLKLFLVLFVITTLLCPIFNTSPLSTLSLCCTFKIEYVKYIYILGATLAALAKNSTSKSAKYFTHCASCEFMLESIILNNCSVCASYLCTKY